MDEIKEINELTASQAEYNLRYADPVYIEHWKSEERRLELVMKQVEDWEEKAALMAVLKKSQSEHLNHLIEVCGGIE